VANGSIDAVLATAAAEDYATGLACRLGFRHVLATTSARTEPCNKGAHKRERVLALLASQGWRHRPLVLFTDHIDDLPLIRDSALVCWYGPAGKMMQAAEAAPDTGFIFCRDLSAAEIVAGLQDRQMPASALS
jgi:phosphoserine phosphatase